MEKVSKEDLISIIVPVYKVEKYLKRCLDSIINQTYTNLEIILVDDGSPDNSGKICDEYALKDNRITVIHKENGGVSSARNTGLNSSTGKWISFVDSDDWIDENYFSTMMRNINDDVDVIICSYNRVVNEKYEQIRYFYKTKSLNNYEYLNNVLNPQSGFGFCHMKLYRKKVIHEINFNENLKVGEDALFNLKISSNIKKAIFIPDTLYNYRINSESVVKKFDIEYVQKYLKAMQYTKEYIFNNYKDKFVYQNYYNYVAFHLLLISVNYCFHKKNKLNGRKELKKVCNILEFREALQKSNYNNISLTRKISLFCLKYKLYFIMELICRIRQKQNSGGIS